jgi:hypothetical protein
MVMGTTLITPPVLKPLFNRSSTSDEAGDGARVARPGMSELE